MYFRFLKDVPRRAGGCCSGKWSFTATFTRTWVTWNGLMDKNWEERTRACFNTFPFAIIKTSAHLDSELFLEEKSFYPFRPVMPSRLRHRREGNFYLCSIFCFLLEIDKCKGKLNLSTKEAGEEVSINASLSELCCGVLSEQVEETLREYFPKQQP